VIKTISAERSSEVPIPDGWYLVGTSADFCCNSIVPVRLGEHKLLGYRKASDLRVVLLSTYCPHLGADIGVGGVLETDGVRCPFHGWKFDPDGRCSNVPYSKEIPRVGLRSFPTHETASLVFAWLSAGEADPWFTLPELPDRRRSGRQGSLDWEIGANVFDILENIADRAHFVVVHDISELPDVDVSWSGDSLTLLRTQSYWNDEREEWLKLTYRSDCHGPGLVVSTVGGPIANTTIACVTPLGSGRVSFRLFITVGDSIDNAHALEVLQRVEESARLQVGRDIPIWEAKVYLARPTLVSGDGPVREMRTWLRQFVTTPGSPVLVRD
jgi:phenylpropionate dioxygenase-like ring-hydroxylating dioxygenase large terminal subunit